MGEFRQTALVFVSTFALSGLGLTLVAQAQNSPFAKKDGKQAWETPSPSNTTQSSTQTNTQTNTQINPQTNPRSGTYQSVGSLTPPSSSSSSAGGSYPSTYSYQLPSSSGANASTPPTVSSGGSPYPSTYSGNPVPSTPSSTSKPQTQAYPIQSYRAPTSNSQASGTYQPGATYDYPQYGTPTSTQPSGQTSSGTYYPGRTQQPSSYNGAQNQTQSRSPFAPRPQNQPQYPTQQTQPTAQQGYAYQSPQQRQRTFQEKLGWNNIDYFYEGALRVGGAGTYQDVMSANDSWREDFVVDGFVYGEVSAITPGGLEYGVAGEVRGQYDKYRRGFGGRAGDCPAGNPLCPSVNINGTDTALRGHTSRFYADGASDAKDLEVQLEKAHLFLRSGYGDVTIGRDDGAAYLFSLGAPTLLTVGASNNPVDYTGLDSVKTVNDASGFAEKITYTSPRLLGDQIGVGIQLGASYALDAKACGVDYCVRGNSDEPAGVLAPDLDDVMEFGIALDRKFDNGLSIEATGTYARASEQSGLNVFDDLETFGLAMELGYGDFVLGGSYLNSNNGLANGDYKAMDVGLTWQPSKWGVTLGYGHAKDENIGLTADQAIFGVSYDFRENLRFGTGVQYVNRDVPVQDPTTLLVNGQNENAASVFVEGRFTF